MRRTNLAIHFLAALVLFHCGLVAAAKEIALTFDDVPMNSSGHFQSLERTKVLLKKLKALNVPPVMIFANPCKDKGSVQQLQKYRDSGHVIANHSCSHPRLDSAGFDAYTKDIEQGDIRLASLFSGQKFFRFPFLNEGSETKLRDEVRNWLSQREYRNGMVSIDNDDHIFSHKINQAKKKGKPIDYGRVKTLFLNHVLGAADFYDDLAQKTIGRSPKHVLLLHEMDATVMFIDSLIEELRKKGWQIIPATEAYQDSLYQEAPKNTYAGNGIISQIAFERTGKKIGYYEFDEVKAELNRILGL